MTKAARTAKLKRLPDLFNDVRTCIGFYTIIPVWWRAASQDDQLNDAAGISANDQPDNDQRADVTCDSTGDLSIDLTCDFANTQWAAPLVGMFIGAFAAGIYALAAYAGCSDLVSASLTVTATIGLTGALHEDGLADVADGFGGGRGTARKLDIMKDSRIGTYGVMALLASFVLRLAALHSLGTASGAGTSASGGVIASDGNGTLLLIGASLIAAHGASRAVLPLFAGLTAPARRDGLAVGLNGIRVSTIFIALCFGALALLGCGIASALIMALLLALYFALLRALTLAQIDGQTGDVLGTLQQGCEIIILLSASVLLS